MAFNKNELKQLFSSQIMHNINPSQCKMQLEKHFGICEYKGPLKAHPSRMFLWTFSRTRGSIHIPFNAWSAHQFSSKHFICILFYNIKHIKSFLLAVCMLHQIKNIGLLYSTPTTSFA